MPEADFSIQTDLDLGGLYESNVERTRSILEFYREFYDLPTVLHEDEVTPELFEYCRQRDFFVNILAFIGDRVFMRRALGPRLGWELPGSAIKSKGNEVVQDAAFRIMMRDIPNIDIGELCPIAYIEKRYICEGKELTHHGITFMGRARNISPEDIEKQEHIKGRFIRVTSPEEVARIQGPDKEIFNCARRILQNPTTSSLAAIDREIASTPQVSRLVLFLHRHIIGPIGRAASSSKIKAKILEYVNESDQVLDVACGDDTFIFQVASRARLCVANDVQWAQIEKLITFNSVNRVKFNNVLFTNHDACQLPFRKPFDLTLCKNVLHHMTSRDQLIGLLASLRRVSRRILIIDPEDPEDGGWSARAWHAYYVRCLHDQGERFFSELRFRKVLTEYFGVEHCEFGKVRTIKGNYMLCHITQEKA